MTYQNQFELQNYLDSLNYSTNILPVSDQNTALQLYVGFVISQVTALVRLVMIRITNTELIFSFLSQSHSLLNLAQLF